MTTTTRKIYQYCYSTKPRTARMVAQAYKRGTVGDAEIAVGGLSNPSKMPGKSTGTDPRECNIGSMLREIPGSVCEGCYAFKGMYMMANVAPAHARRLAAIYRTDWVPMMATAIGRSKFHRWHDSGDVQSMSHLIKIVAVALLRSDVSFWLPTREYGLITAYKDAGGTFPSNLVVRMSAPMVGTALPARAGNSSMVLSKGATAPADTYVCNASPTRKAGTTVATITPENRADLGHCGDCRACWTTSVIRTAYPIH